MPKARVAMHSNLVKNKAIVHYKHFLRSLRKVAQIYKIGKSTLARWLKNDGVVIKRKQKSSILDKINILIEDKLLKNPFLTTIELSKLVKDELKLNASKTSCWRSLRLGNFSRKLAALTYHKRNKPLIVEEFKKRYIESKNLVSIDETFFYYDIPRYGYSKKGQQLRKQLGDNPKKNKITLYMAISEKKIVGYKLSKTHGNSNDFLEFLQSLELKGTTLLMDNVIFHKTRIVKDYVASINANILYTPPYSPEYNPIELAFSKIKTIYRKQCLETDLTKLERINNSIKSLSALDCQNFFKHVSELIQKFD